MYEKIKENSVRLKTPAFYQDKMLSNVVTTKKTTKLQKLQQNWLVVAAVLVIALGLNFFIVNSGKEKIIIATELTQSVKLSDNSSYSK